MRWSLVYFGLFAQISSQQAHGSEFQDHNEHSGIEPLGSSEHLDASKIPPVAVPTTTLEAGPFNTDLTSITTSTVMPYTSAIAGQEATQSIATSTALRGEPSCIALSGKFSSPQATNGTRNEGLRFDTSSKLQVNWTLWWYHEFSCDVFVVQEHMNASPPVKMPLIQRRDRCEAYPDDVWDPMGRAHFEYSNNSSELPYHFELRQSGCPEDSPSIKSDNFFVENPAQPTSSSSNSTADNGQAPAASSSPQLAAQTASSVESGNHDNALKIGLGVGLGVGIPLLAAVGAAAFFMLRKKKASANNDPYSRQPLDPSAEHVVATGYNKGFDDHSPPFPPVSTNEANGVAAGAAAGTTARAAAGARESHQLQPLDTAMPTPATGVDASPVSPLSRRSSVSSISTMGPRTNPRTSTMVSEHY